MIRKLLREFYLLPRGEQRAMILVSLLLLLSLAARVVVQVMPEKETPGMDQFLEETSLVMARLAEADSLKKRKQDSLSTARNRDYTSSYERTWQKRSLLPGSVNLNTVDSTGLLPLPGIGPVFAGRIIKYRSLLGGFCNSGQLAEVYGLNQEVIPHITPYIYIDTALVRKLKINSDGFRDLLRHPYLEYEDVKALVKYRDFVGQISSLDGLRQDSVVPDTVLEKISPYLDL